MSSPSSRSPATTLDARRWICAATFSLLLLLPLVVFLTTCSQPDNSGSSGSGYGAITLKLVRPGGDQAFTLDTGFHPLALANAQSVVAAVSGADMATVTKTFDATPGVSGSGVIDSVPAGSNRTVTVNGYTGDNGTGTLYYQAILTGVSVAAGQTNNLGAVTIYQVAPGTLDDSFGTAGYVISDGAGQPVSPSSMVIDSSGRILIVGSSSTAAGTITHMTVWRYNANGTPDTTFNGGSGSNNYITHDGAGSP